jgi:hypothetical protein
MFRRFTFSFVAVLLASGLVFAEEKKDAKEKTVNGAFASYKDGTLTIKVKGKKGEEPKATDFKIADDLKVTVIDGDTKKDVVAKDAFKDVKEGTAVTVKIGEGDKVTAVQVGTAKKGDKGEKTVNGAFASYKDGTLTIKVKGKKGEEPKATDFKVADDLKVTILDGDTKKDAVAKDAFKDVKEGTAVKVTLSDGDKVSAVQVGTAKKKNK